MKKVSIKDVAAQAGVSAALVSYVLNGKLTGRINKETAEIVRSTAAALGYQPNSIAKSLKLQKTLTIGLIVADISNPFAAGLARIIEDAAQQRGYTVIMGSSDENELKSQQLINSLLRRQVDGFIISPVMNTEAQIQQLVGSEVPLVLIDRYFPAIKTSNVFIDNYQASYNATRHLLATGRKSPAIITYRTELVHLQERLRGFEQALTDSNLLPAAQANVGLVRTTAVEEDVEQIIAGFLQANAGIDSLYFTSNKLAVAGLKYLVARTIQIPDELSVVAFDETDAYDLFYAPITYVKQPLGQIGQTAVAVLLDQIQGRAAPVADSIFKAELVVRRSSTPAPVQA